MRKKSYLCNTKHINIISNNETVNIPFARSHGSAYDVELCVDQENRLFPGP